MGGPSSLRSGLVPDLGGSVESGHTSQARGPLRVLIVHNRYRSAEPSGEDRVVDQEVDLLSEAGHEVVVFEKDSDNIQRMSLAAKTTVPLLVPWNPFARRELRQVLRSHRPDVVHIHSTFPLLSPAVFDACADVGVPVVATLHNYGLICPIGSLFRDGHDCTECVGGSPLPAVRHGCYRGSRVASLPVAALALTTRRVHRLPARYLCISEAQRRLLYQAGVPGDRLDVVRNFVPDLGAQRSTPGEYVLYVGRLTDSKGIPDLMVAWDRLTLRGGIGVPLVLAGSGPREADLRQWARGRKDVRVAGLRSRPECADLMAKAAVVVAPSRWQEPFGLTVVEAMAAAVPVVVTARGALPELVEDGTTGIIADPGSDGLGDALARSMADLERNQQMGRAGRARYERMFTSAVGLAHLEAALTRAVQGVAA